MKIAEITSLVYIMARFELASGRRELALNRAIGQLNIRGAHPGVLITACSYVRVPYDRHRLELRTQVVVPLEGFLTESI